MATIDLADILKLYRTPGKKEDPAIESRALLRHIVETAGSAYPKVTTTGYMTHIALPEKDGDVHFYTETKEGVDSPTAPMMACEIQGIYKGGKKNAEDPRMKVFRQLFGKRVVVEALFRAWPEHLRDSTQPHLFELHPVLKIGEPGKKAIDFTDRVIWPTGEDPEEMARTFAAVANPPNGLKISIQSGRIVFRTPSKSMKKENYIHLDGFYRGDGKTHGSGFLFNLYENQTGARALACFCLDGSPSFKKAVAMKPGRYEMGGLSGLDLNALMTATPEWKAQLSPVLSVKRI